MKTLVCSLTLSVAVASFAATTVTVTSTTRDASNGAISVAYTLAGDPAVVTFSGSTNGIALPDRDFRTVWGDVNRLVQPGEGHVVSWVPARDKQGFISSAVGFKAELKAWPTNSPPDYMVLDLQSSDFSYYVSTDCMPYPHTNRIYMSDCLVMRKVPAAGVVWRMGSPTTETGRDTNYEATRYVKLTEDYYLGIYELTARQVYYLCGRVDPYSASIPDGSGTISSLYGSLNMKDSGYVTGDELNTTPFSFACYTRIRTSEVGDAVTSWPGGGHTTKAGCFIHLAQSKYSVLFDLPTDAQWEFAARGGEDLGRFTADQLDKVAWCAANSTKTLLNGETMKFPHRPGGKAPNGYGLYDMFGNLFESVLDWATTVKQDVDDPTAVVVNPKGGDADDTTSNAPKRLFRGGSFAETANACRAAYKMAYNQGWWDGPRKDAGTEGINKRAGGARLWAPAQAVR